MSDPAPYWKTIVGPAHSHRFPVVVNVDEIGVGSVWVCSCKTEFTYTKSGATGFDEIVK